MREIKFRAWHPVNKKFEYATLAELWENGFRCAENLQWNGGPRHEYIQGSEWEKWKNAFFPTAEWRQHTGLKDKNGREIYEGDILCNPKVGDIGPVEWDGIDAGFSWRHPKMYNGTMDECEIIGNIYENPELLDAR